MISDVLSDAVTQITRYQQDRTFRSAYRDLKPEIAVVVTLMDALRGYLDCCPLPDCPEIEKKQQALSEAICNTDVRKVLRAHRQLLAAVAKARKKKLNAIPQSGS